MIAFIRRVIFYILFIMTNKFPKTFFCQKCGIYNTPTRLGNCNGFLFPKTTFFDWEAYLQGKPYNGKKCDLILIKSEEVVFIEHKAKDWFALNKHFPPTQKNTYALTHPDVAKKLIEQRLKELSDILKDKIVDTVTKYLDDGFPISKGRYVVVYSKKHSFNWHDRQLSNAHIRHLILTRILSRSYSIRGLMIPADCVQCDKFNAIKKNGTKKIKKIEIGLGGVGVNII